MGNESDQYLQKVIDKINSGIFPSQRTSNPAHTASGEILNNVATLSAETGSGKASQPEETISFQKPEIPEVKTRVSGTLTGPGQLVRKSPTKQEVVKGLSS